MTNVNVLQLSWDDVSGTYGGIQTQVISLMTRQAPIYGTTVALTLPTMFSPQLRLPASGDYLGLQTLREDLIYFVSSNNIDVVHTHNLHRAGGFGVADSLVAVIAEIGVPHVTTIHDFNSALSADELKRQCRLLETPTRIATSQFVRNALIAVSGLESQVIPPSLPISTPRASKASSPLPTVVCPGRLLPQKGQLEAVSLCGYVSREIGGVRLLLSNRLHAHNGSGLPYIEELLRVASCFPNLRLDFFHGSNPFPSVYEEADLTLCLPTGLEGFSLVPLESAAVGTPTITIPNGGMEWVLQYPNAIMALERDYVAIAGHIRSVLQQRPYFKHLAKRDQAAVNDKYSVEKMIATYDEVYARVKLTVVSN